SRAGPRVPGDAPLALLRLPRPVRMEEEVRAQLRRPLPGGAVDRAAAGGGDGAGAGAASGRTWRVRAVRDRGRERLSGRSASSTSNLVGDVEGGRAPTNRLCEETPGP